MVADDMVADDMVASGRSHSAPQTFCLFKGDRAVVVRIKQHQVFALSLWDLIADQFAITIAVEASLELISSSRGIKAG